MSDIAERSIPVAVFIQTKNEEASIARAIGAVKAFAEVVVIDSESTDRTQEIATGLGARVVNFVWDGNYPKKKQWQLESVQTECEWVLFLDADEYPSKDLVSEISNSIEEWSREDYGACDIPIFYRFNGRFLRHGHTVVKRVLVRPRSVAFPVLQDLDVPGMGELEGHYQPAVAGRIHRCKGELYHDDIDPISTWFVRHNRYSDWEAEVRTRPTLRRAIGKVKSRQGKFFDRVPGKPLVFFVYSYIWRRGYLDGRDGFDYALALCFYYWQIGLKMRALRQNDQLKDRMLSGECT